ncbi:MAG: acid phosphatase [Candidatus Eremiobacteraeota bacterium]|nr:acid phosphatase [Candidatus Eremiobacteraeota bacterium]
MKRSWLLAVLVAAFCAGCLGSSAALPGTAPAGRSVGTVNRNTAPHASSVLVVIMENRDYDLIIGSKDAPYINKQLVPQAALMTNSHAIGHPSQPNYLAFFSGSTQGINDDSCPHTFNTVNVGEELLAARSTFDGYSESMPSDGFTGCYSGEYARKHNPWVNFTNVPASSNLVYQGYVTPSTLTIVVPNLCHDMHDCSTQTGDQWLKTNLPPFLKYGKNHDGLFVLTWDEAAPDKNGQNQIATLLIGPMIKPGKYAQKISHYSVLRTIEDIFSLACTAKACQAHDLTGMWR